MPDEEHELELIKADPPKSAWAEWAITARVVGVWAVIGAIIVVPFWLAHR